MKSFLSILILLIAAITGNAQTVLKGDMNDDGKLTIEDVTLLTQAILSNQHVEPQDTDSISVLQSFAFMKSLNKGKVIEDLNIQTIGDTIAIETPFILDASSLIASFETDGDTVYVNDVRQTSGETANDFTAPVKYRVLSGKGYNKEYVVKVTYSGLPVLYIDTPDTAAITSKDNWMQNASLRMVDVDGTEVAQTTSIKGRGYSTWDMPKKPYTLKLDKKSGFLGMAKGKRWCLLANYSDKTSLRTELAFTMSRDSRLAWTPDTRFVELVLNGTHQGLYQLCEQIKIDENRVNVGDDGYILEVDQLDRMTDEDVYFQTFRFVYNIKDPDTEKDGESYNWIKDYVSNAEDTLYLQNGTGYRKFIEMESFVDWYLVNEIARNNDAVFYSSCYMNMRKDGKLNMGPVWDFDIAYGNINFDDNWLTEGLWVASYGWIQRMLQIDTEFKNMVKERFQYFYNNKEKYIASIASNSQKLSSSVQLNDNIWKTMNTYVWPNYVVKGSYEGEIEYLKNWLTERFESLKKTFDEM